MDMIYFDNTTMTKFSSYDEKHGIYYISFDDCEDIQKNTNGDINFSSIDSVILTMFLKDKLPCDGHVCIFALNKNLVGINSSAVEILYM